MSATITKERKTKKTGDENTLSIYLKEINNIPLLSRADEEKYARLAAAGDQAARDILVKSNLRFVVNVAKKYKNQGIPLSDLINEGNIGLLNAVEKFDVDRGYHFISYAVWWIKQAILKAIGEKSRMIRLPLNRAGELVQIKRLKKEYLAVNGVDPDLGDIASDLNLTEDHVRQMISISRDHISIDTPVTSGERDSAKISDYIEDTRYKQPDEVIVDKSLKEEINKLLATLSGKEADIIEQRFGLNGETPQSLKEIGDRFNLTKERIRQIEKKALERLKHVSRKQYLEAYI
ncbi:MAG: RNA polymerase sigma factor RpoD/SigA [Spirochaetia bacterium]|jgi:RNA polymerase primary sigma factor|nr:RNA polymerase sigma factor RpoD/SigA [Spirochaetia bacterium]